MKSWIWVAVAASLATATAASTSPATPAHHSVFVNAIAISGSKLFVANADGSDEHPLLSDGKFEYDASYSQDGNWIVFTSERDGPANIYRVHPDGSGMERLTEHPGFDDQAVMSPDSAKLAYVSTRKSGVTNIWILDLKTRVLRDLTGALPYAKGGRHSYMRPSWSPDGRWIAFSSDRNTPFENHKFPSPGWEHVQRSSVYIIGVDGKGLRRISDGKEYGGSPKWSADGKQLVFYTMNADQSFAVRVVGLEQQLAPAPTDTQIVTVDIATGKRQTRTNSAGVKVNPQFVGADNIGYALKGTTRGELAYTDPMKIADGAPTNIENVSWSADGKQVIYSKYEYNLKLGDSLHSADPSFSLRFTPEFPSVSRQGRLAFTAFPHDEGSVANLAMGKTLAAVALQLSDAHEAPPVKVFEQPGIAAMSATWSPDGNRLVITEGVMKLGSPSQLLMLNADGSDAHQLTNDPAMSSSFPSWSPDGTRIAYRIRGDKEQGLRIMNLKDNSTRVLTKNHDSFPFWSPDGKEICFTRDVGGPQAFDIFTIHPDGTGLKRLTNAPGNDAHCGWSPDSRYIMFSSSRLGYRDEGPLYDKGFAQPYAELFIMNANGSNQHPITDDKWEQGTPAWVPEGLVQ